MNDALRALKETIRELAAALGSKGRVKILVALAQAHRRGLTLSPSKLKSITQLKSAYVERNLEALVRLGWVEEIAFVGGKRFRLKADNPIVEELINFLKHVGCA